MLVQGRMMESSWSRPIMLAPFFWRMPMTLNMTFLMRMSLPSGSSSPKSSLATVWPMTHTRLACSTSSSEKGWPRSMSYQLLIFRYSTEPPSTVSGLQFLLP